ncbi:hypothetical protein L873DRAFT_1807661 [Choiromyces venosus 120613-1]|uniref:Uncharacterized protein n=1 Tax=Choiromyces venosus 120613-1 TaxID=1336337 RepID=A0A3N4JZ57_9PEZI|nr:hypothetical protein L873DRAFT_1807661 [Choiromyces venosus 120613-1]
MHSPTSTDPATINRSATSNAHTVTYLRAYRKIQHNEKFGEEQGFHRLPFFADPPQTLHFSLCRIFRYTLRYVTSLSIS